MLVILTDEQVLSTQQVCQGCLLATKGGSPRWNGGKLGCGQAVTTNTGGRLALYECQMGFRVAEIS